MEEVTPVELSIQEENEQKKEYLRSYRKALRREERILDEIQELRMNKMFPSVANDGMPRGSEQYIKGLKWEKIAVEMGYAWAQIHRIHSSALKNLKMIHNDIK